MTLALAFTNIFAVPLGSRDLLNMLEESRESDESDSLNLSLSSSSSPQPSRLQPFSSSPSRPSLASLHELADPYLPSFRGKDLSDARAALAKVLTSSVSKGALIKRLKNSSTFPKFSGGSSSSHVTDTGWDNRPPWSECLATSNPPAEPQWEDPSERRGTSTFKVVPLEKANLDNVGMDHDDASQTPEEANSDRGDFPKSDGNPPEAVEDHSSPDNETSLPSRRPCSQATEDLDRPVAYSPSLGSDSPACPRLQLKPMTAKVEDDNFSKQNEQEVTAPELGLGSKKPSITNWIMEDSGPSPQICNQSPTSSPQNPRRLLQNPDRASQYPSRCGSPTNSMDSLQNLSISEVTGRPPPNQSGCCKNPPRSPEIQNGSSQNQNRSHQSPSGSPQNLKSESLQSLCETSSKSLESPNNSPQNTSRSSQNPAGSPKNPNSGCSLEVSNGSPENPTEFPENPTGSPKNPSGSPENPTESPEAPLALTQNPIEFHQKPNSSPQNHGASSQNSRESPQIPTGFSENMTRSSENPSESAPNSIESTGSPKPGDSPKSRSLKNRNGSLQNSIESLQNPGRSHQSSERSEAENEEVDNVRLGEKEVEDDDAFPPPPSPVFFNGDTDESEASSSPLSRPPTPASKHCEDPRPANSGPPEQPEATAEPPEMVSAAAPSRFAEAVALAVQRSRLQRQDRGPGPQAPSAQNSALPSPHISIYQFGKSYHLYIITVQH